MSETDTDPKVLRAKVSPVRGLDVYLSEVGRHELITEERERALGHRALQGDEEAAMELARANLRFGIQIAKKYQNRGLSLPDLIQEANVGLVTAARRFDPDRGVKFISYAVWWIRQAILAALATHSRPVRVPLNRNGDLSRIARTRRELSQKLGRPPTSAEIAKASGLRLDEVEKLQPLNHGAVRLDAPLGDEPGEQKLVERFEVDEADEPVQAAEARFLMEQLDRALATLRERDAAILRMYFGLGGMEPMTLEEIGQVYGVTRERVRQIRNRALDELKDGEWGVILRSFAA